VRVLIRRLSAANPLWGAPRIVGELRKIGIDVTKATVEKYMVRRRGPASPTWMTFLRTHAARDDLPRLLRRADRQSTRSSSSSSSSCIIAAEFFTSM